MKLKYLPPSLVFQLLFMGRDYPAGEALFKERLRHAFRKNMHVSDPNEIRKLIARGNYMARELQALYHVRKYRAMKSRYYNND
uniref:Complex 1 LYR protein domain-containing protein n=1 Tax=Eptatretus burgeri TaxID=7764 RepID=A0A8C4QDA9_EPTBU